jgi:cysteine desulfurase
MRKNRIYLDNAATTYLFPEVATLMSELLHKNYGNPSSVHAEGRKAKSVLEDSRKTIANTLRASTGEIFFTSCATESNNMVFHCSIRDLNVNRIISSPTEHPSVFNALEEIKKEGKVEIIYLSVDNEGNPSVNELEDHLKGSNKKTLVSLMHANNEIGTMISLQSFGDLCKEYGALFHTDATQSLGKYEIDLDQLNINFLSASAHKFHGPKGIGIIYINGDNIIEPFFYGGGQERKLRSGTENISGTAGMAKALSICCENLNDRTEKINALRDYLKSKLITQFPDIHFNGNQESYLYTVLSVSFPLTPKTDLLTFQLDIEGISASAGSACSSGTEKASSVLSSINFPEDRKAVRFSFSEDNTIEELDYLIDVLSKVLATDKAFI